MTRSTPARSPRYLVLGLGLAAALPISLAPAATAAVDGVSTATIHVDATQPGRVIPLDFLGLSFEADLLNQPWTDPEAGNIDELLMNLGTGTMRFSANQVDNTAWMPDPSAPAPAWSDGKQVTPADLTRLDALAKTTGWSVDLGVNLGHFDPAAAASQAVVAQDSLGDSLRSIQIGNEPNFYLLAPLLNSGERRPYLPHTYVPDARSYREAIRAVAPTVAIEGPDTAGAAVGHELLDPALSAITAPWLDTYIAEFGSESRFLNHHYYPFINTERLGLTSGSSDLIGGLPTVDRLMSRETAASQTRFLREFVGTAESAGLEPKLAETNSVAKEGREGVTNSFGAALWTVDYLMTAAREGVTGVNLHNQPYDCESYALLCFRDEAAGDSGAAQVNPNYYGALMVSTMVGGAVLPVVVDSDGANISAHAVRMPDGAVKVIIDNMDRSFRGEVRVEISGHEDVSASIERLGADSPDATSGVEFADASVAEDGTFTAVADETVASVDGSYPISIGAPSAVLVSTQGPR